MSLLKARAFGPIFPFVWFLALLLTMPALASPERNIVIHNNTGATLTMFLRQGTWQIPPNSRQLFQNILIDGRNQLFFSARCVDGQPSLDFEAWVTGAQGQREYSFFARNFGKSVMFDKPSCSAGGGAITAACLGIIGHWKWFTGYEVDFYDNYTWRTSDGSDAGSWRCLSDGRIVIVPNHAGWRDTVAVSPDGRSLLAQDQYGVSVRATSALPKSNKCPTGYNPYGC